MMELQLVPRDRRHSTTSTSSSSSSSSTQSRQLHEEPEEEGSSSIAHTTTPCGQDAINDSEGECDLSGVVECTPLSPSSTARSLPAVSAMMGSASTLPSPDAAQTVGQTPARPKLPVSLRSLLASIFVHMLITGMQLIANPKMELHIFEGSAARAARTNAYLAIVTKALGFFFGPLLASLSDVYGRRPFLLVSFLCYAVALALIGVSYSLAGLVIANCLTAAFDSSGSVTYAVVSDMMPTTEFVSMYSLFNAAGSAGLLFGPVFAVASMKVNEHGATFLLASLLALANLAWLAKQLPETLHWRQRLEQSQREVQTDMQEESIDMRVIEDEEEGISSTIDANDHSHLVGDEPASDDAQIHVHLSTISHAYASSSTDEGESAAPSPSPSPSPLDSDPMLQQPAPFSPDRPFNLREIVRLPTSNPFHSVSILWHSGPVLRRLTLAFVLHLLADGALGAIVFLYTAVRWNWGSSENAGMMILSGAAGVIVMIGVGPRLVRSARFGEERTYRLAQFVSIVLQLGFILSPWSWLLLPIGLFGSIGFMWSPTLRARLSRQVPAAQQGELQGAISCVSAIGMTISSVGANALFSVCADKDSDFFFPELVFLVAAIVNLASIAADFGLDTRGIDERGVEGGSSPTAESTNETNIDSSHHTLTTGDTCELSFKLPAAPAEADATSDEDDRALV